MKLGDRILFFDTETTGLPKDKHLNAMLSRGNWPDLVSISWILCEVGEAGPVRLAKESHIIQPQGWFIPADSTKIHGISMDDALARGVPLTDVLQKFKEAMTGCRHIVAHNMEFDRNVMLGAYKWRLGGTPSFWPYSAEICTMMISRDELRLPAKYPKKHDPYKLPRLDELWQATFGTAPPANAHSADRDTEVLEKIFWARWFTPGSSGSPATL
jgi:DNA polymerase III epsilon subunit-like protein